MSRKIGRGICDPIKITHKDFEKLELRVGTIKAAKVVNGEYLLAIDLEFAEKDIQVVIDIKKSYKINELIGKQVVVLLNICPELVKGYESQGMILIATKEGKPVLIGPEKKVHPGVKVSGMMDSNCVHFGK